MSIFLLDDELIFPHPSLADRDGFLAVGGDLSIERLLLAYSNGIFPWPHGLQLFWASPDPRLILLPEKFKLSKSLKQTLRNKPFKVKSDTVFKEVVTNCAQVSRKENNGTWITQEIIRAYCALHELGLAHSIEVFFENKLVGGLYGVSLGKVFMGESMFYKERDASKVALYYLVRIMKTQTFDFIDAQVPTEHLIRLGAERISREKYLEMLNKSLEHETLKGVWRI
ncbi:MAG: leucyl/phenylalanyl-tRNA--protein transferase [Bacteroidia bacterium]|nr:MAG: leucyl/phenylalanyl-tRNA--protein transferase [Bacteroidia bacterium]